MLIFQVTAQTTAHSPSYIALEKKLGENLKFYQDQLANRLKKPSALQSESQITYSMKVIANLKDCILHIQALQKLLNGQQTASKSAFVNLWRMTSVQRELFNNHTDNEKIKLREVRDYIRASNASSPIDETVLSGKWGATVLGTQNLFAEYNKVFGIQEQETQAPPKKKDEPKKETQKPKPKKQDETGIPKVQKVSHYPFDYLPPECKAFALSVLKNFPGAMVDGVTDERTANNYLNYAITLISKYGIISPDKLKTVENLKDLSQDELALLMLVYQYSFRGYGNLEKLLKNPDNAGKSAGDLVKLFYDAGKSEIAQGMIQPNGKAVTDRSKIWWTSQFKQAVELAGKIKPGQSISNAPADQTTDKKPGQKSKFDISKVPGYTADFKFMGNSADYKLVGYNMDNAALYEKIGLSLGDAQVKQLYTRTALGTYVEYFGKKINPTKAKDNKQTPPSGDVTTVISQAPGSKNKEAEKTGTGAPITEQKKILTPKEQRQSNRDARKESRKNERELDKKMRIANREARKNKKTGLSTAVSPTFVQDNKGNEPSTKLAEINVIPSYSGKDVTGYSADLPAGFASSKGEIPVKSDGRELFSLNEKDRADLFAGTLLEKDDFKVKFNGNKLEITIVPKVKDNDIVVVDMAPVAPYIYATGDCKVPEIDAMLSSPAVLEKIKNKVLGYGVTAQTFNEKLPNFIRFVNDDKLKGENSLLSLSPVKDWEELAGMLKDYIGN